MEESQNTEPTSLDTQAFLFFVLMVAVFVGIAYLVRSTAFLVHYRELLLEISYWATIGIAGLGFVLALFGTAHYLAHEDESILVTALFSLVMGGIFGWLTYIITSPLRPPAGYAKALDELYKLDVQSSSWMSDAFDLWMEYQDGIAFLQFRLGGLFFMMIAMLIVYYVQLRGIFSLLKHKPADIAGTSMLISLLLAGLAALMMALGK